MAITGAIVPKYPKGSTLDNVTTDPKVPSYKLVSGETELNIDMLDNGTVYSTVKTEDGTESKVKNVPLFADFNMNEDASISILQRLTSGDNISTNISPVGEVTVGVDSSGSGTGPNVKAPKGAEVTLNKSGTSEISQPAITDESTGISSQVTSTITKGGLAVIKINFSGGSGRTPNVDGSSGTTTSTLIYRFRPVGFH
ncbi:MAG: hypothetical protein CM1200mP30_26820 [Pseudomonadota bacterium]|nr:MAG: hypothetical protein CM1200mP30_26820 [Pseudomonadota bacterium]